MTQNELFHDDIYSALRSVVEMLGGAKRVASRLRPNDDPMDAERWLLDCLNPRRKHKLDLAEFMQIFGMSVEADIHVLAGFFGMRFNYEFRIVTPEDKAAKAAEEFASMKRQFMAMAPMLGLKVTE